jgi:urease accessory protein
VRALTLLFSDGRFPAGGHAHSGGVEQACDDRIITDVAQLEDFLRGRLATAGIVAAHTAAAVCGQARRSENPEIFWRFADEETDSRIQSPASRAVSRQQGGRMLRTARQVLDSPVLESLARSSTESDCEPHHPVVVGAVAAATDLPPLEAAEVAAYAAVSGPASAALRLLGLDPALVARVLVEIAAEIDSIAMLAADTAFGPMRRIPCPSAPMMDLLAEEHFDRKERLFAS